MFDNKLIRRRKWFSHFLAACTSAGIIQATEDEDAPAQRQVVHLQIGDNVVIRRDPQSGTVLSAALSAFDLESPAIDRLGDPVSISPAGAASLEPPPLELPRLMSHSLDLTDLEEVAGGDVLELHIDYIDDAPLLEVRRGILALSSEQLQAAAAAVKIASLTFSFERRTDVLPPCLGKKKTGCRIKVDYKVFLLGNRRLFSAYVSRDGSTIFVHGEIGPLGIRWCWKISPVLQAAVDLLVRVVSYALDAAGLSESSAKVLSTAQALRSAINKTVPKLLP